MSSLVDDIISVLDAEFTEEPSSKSWVIAVDGETVRMNGELWKESPVLREHAASGSSQKVLAASKSALEAVNQAHREDIFPIGIRESYELFAAASELQLGELTSECFGNLCTLNYLDESVDLPSELPVDAAMKVFNVLFNSPLRTVDIYRGQLKRIARYCASNRDVMTNAINTLKQSLEKFKSIDLEGIPASFQSRTLPVAIYKRKGELQTAVILGAEVRPIKLFGSRINLGNIHEDGFYLKYGVYLLYLYDSNVYYKCLLDESEPRVVLGKCYKLITKGNFVLAAQNEMEFCSIFHWTDDVKFEKIYQTASCIVRMEFDYNTGLLAVVLSECILRLFRFENETLFLLKEMTDSAVIDVLLLGRNMFIYRQVLDETWIETHCVVTMGEEESGLLIAEQPAGDDTPMKIKNSLSVSDCQISHVGERFFLRDSTGLEVLLDFPSSKRIEKLMTAEELVALSELWMSP